MSVVLVALLSLASLPLKAAPTITLEVIEGKVQYRSAPTQPWRLVSGKRQLQINSELMTGARGSAIVRQGGTSIRLKPNSHIQLQSQAAPEPDLMNRIKQWLGSALYKVEENPAEFSVETPFLVSTVKGTEFIIVTDAQDSYVSLLEGRLEIRDLRSGELQILEPGDIATVSVATEQGGLRKLEASPNRGNPVSGTPSSAGDSALQDGASATMEQATTDPREGFVSDQVEGGFLTDIETSESILDEQRTVGGTGTPVTDDDPATGGGDPVVDDGSGDDGDGGAVDDGTGDDGSGDDDRGHGNDDDGLDDDNPGQGDSGDDDD